MPEHKMREDIPMNASSGRLATSRPARNPGKARLAKPAVQATEWELADERLDEALRQTFPASDALSIIQNVRDRQ
jgi:hypothetical protein